MMMPGIPSATLHSWRKQIMEEARVLAMTDTLPEQPTRRQMIDAYMNGVSQGMAKILETLRLHECISVTYCRENDT